MVLNYSTSTSNYLVPTLISIGIKVLVAGVSFLIYDFWVDFSTGVYETRNQTGNVGKTITTQSCEWI